MCDTHSDQENQTQNGDPEPDIPIKPMMSVPDNTADHSDEDECEDE